MIIGDKYRSVKELKDRKDISENLLYTYDCVKSINILQAFLAIEVEDELYNTAQVENTKLKTGDFIRICRWDWNGMDELERIIELEVKNEHCVKVTTQNGYVNFDTTKEYNSSMFKWKNKKKFDWESKHQQNVDFRNYYYED